MPAWLILTFVALLSWGAWAVLSKVAGDALTPEQSQALSTLGMLPLLVPLALSKRAPLRGVSRWGLLLALIGGVVTCLGNVAYYAALARGEKVATVVSLTALYPLVTVLLAVLVLRERLNRVQLLAFVPVGVFFALREPWPGAITMRAWTLVLALGFFLAFGNYAMLAAFARGGKAAIIAPLGGLYPLISVPIAVLFLGEHIGQREIIGIVIAVVSVAALSWETSPGQSQPPQTEPPH